MSTSSSRSPPTTGCCPRRPPRSSRSPAWACSSAPCATNDPAPAQLDLDAGGSRPTRAEDPAPQGTGHVDHVPFGPARDLLPEPARPDRALEGVHALTRLL